MHRWTNFETLPVVWAQRCPQSRSEQTLPRTSSIHLKSGAGDLTIADMNEEGANMLALQTRQQLSSTALSLANQAEQSVLSLFG
jgi:flagellin-like hook-associated protein FlgL